MQLNLTLGVADLGLTEKFYREILQMRPQRSDPGAGGPDFIFLACGGTSIVFRRLAELEAQHPAVLQNLTRQSLGVGVQLELSCSDLKPIRCSIEQNQWPVVYELEDKEFERSELWLHDPDGYLLVINQEPDK